MDDDLVGQLLDVAARRLAAYGYLLTGSQHAGEDLVQDAIVKVFVKRRRLDNVPAAEGYVRGAMRDIQLAELRRATSWRAGLPRLAPRAQQTPAPRAQQTAAPRAQQTAAPRAQQTPAPRAQQTPAPIEPSPRNPLVHSMAKLLKHERAVIVLRHHDHWTVSEIAAAMRLDETAVERHLSHALATLSRALGDIEPELDQVLVVDRTRR